MSAGLKRCPTCSRYARTDMSAGLKPCPTFDGLGADEALAQLAFRGQPVGKRVAGLPVAFEIQMVRALCDLVVRELDRRNFSHRRERRRCGRSGLILLGGRVRSR